VDKVSIAMNLPVKGEFPVSRCRPIFSRWGRFRLGGLFLGRIAR